jgi:hypothetical protein
LAGFLFPSRALHQPGAVSARSHDDRPVYRPLELEEQMIRAFQSGRLQGQDVGNVIDSSTLLIRNASLTAKLAIIPGFIDVGSQKPADPRSVMKTYDRG